MSKNKQRELKHSTFSLEVKSVSDDGTFTGYGSVFGNMDSYGDIIKPGAFTRTLVGRVEAIKLLWQHNSDQPIGIYTDIKEDNHGLLVTGQLNLDTQLGAEAYSLLKQGALSGLSIGFYTVQSSIDETSGIRTITEIMLLEISLVTFPANEEANVTSVKSTAEIFREFEQLDEKQRGQVRDFINSLTKSSLPNEVDPPISVIEITEQHSTPSEPDTKQTDEPQKDLHSLEQLSVALQKLIKSIEEKNKEVKNGHKD